MPVTLLFYLFCLMVILLLLVNLAWPLINPRYRLFWMFRRDRFVEASRDIEQAETDRAIDAMKQTAENIRKT